MGIFRQFPYSNFHDMNMDQIIKIMREMQDEWLATKTEWTSYKEFIDNYFDNLDVSAEVLAAIRTMAASGELNRIIDPVIATETAAWLAEHITITQGTTVIDDTLSVAGAAADAKTVGDQLDLINDTIDLITEPVSPNFYNYATAVKGTLAVDGTVNPSSYITTDKIRVKAGDVLRGYYNASDGFHVSTAFLVAGLYDINGNFVSRTNTLYSHEYTVPENTYYIRATLQLSYDQFYRNIVITKNQIVDKFYPYVDPNISAVDRVARQKYGEVAKIEDIINDISEKRSPNIFNPATAVAGTLNITGGVNESTFITTDYIPVNPDDVIRFYYVQNGVFKHTGGIWLVSLFDNNKNFISRTNQLYVPEYTVPYNAVYVRLTLSITYSVYVNSTMLTINEAVASFSEHVEPNVTAIDTIAREMASGINVHGLNDRIIDFWGDSFIEMIVSAGTAISDYLDNLIPADYFTSNHGISAETSGMVIARMGINEIYVTVANNTILASGDSAVTAIKAGIGSINGDNVKCTTNALHNNIYCEIAGVKGWLIHTNDTLKFTRETAGSAVTIPPRTRINVIDYNTKNHCLVFMAGKNDLSFNAAGTENVLASYEAAAEYQNSVKYVLLGVTNSVSENYLPGTTLRTSVETINTQLAAKYPNNFIDVQAELISRGLTLEGITPTAQDQQNISNGFIPDSLMADTVHINEYGREAIAKILNEWMRAHNWF